MGVIYIRKGDLSFTSKRDSGTVLKNMTVPRHSVGIIGIMTDEARIGFESVFDKAYPSRIGMTYHNYPELRYCMTHDTSKQVYEQLLKDARALKRAKVTHLTSAVLGYEPLVTSIADELGLETIELSHTIAKNCKTLMGGEVGVVTLTNAFRCDTPLMQALAEREVQSRQLGVELAASFTCVQELTEEKQREYVAAIIHDVNRDSKIGIIILSCPELYLLTPLLKQELATSNRKVVVWDTIRQQELSLRLFGYHKAN